LLRANVHKFRNSGVKVRDEPVGALRIVRIGGVVSAPATGPIDSTTTTLLSSEVHTPGY